MIHAANIILTMKKLRFLLTLSSGNVAVEFALVGLAWVLLMLGICDFGLAINCRAKVEGAASAGVEWIAANSSLYTNAGAQNAAINSTTLPISAVASSFYGCPNGSGITVQASGTTCSSFSATPVGTYATVTASYTYHPISFFFGLGSVTFSASATTRYQ